MESICTICANKPCSCPPWYEQRISELEQENARLRNKLKLLVRSGAIWKSMYSECYDQIGKLRKALEKYGRHLDYCPMSEGYPRLIDDKCTCGLEQALEKEE